MLIKNRPLMFFTLAFVCCITLLPATSHALNYATGIKAAPGYQLNLYPFYYAADHRTNKDGNHSVSGLGLNKYGVYIGNNYYIGDFLLNATIPVGALEVGKLKSDDTGLGDIQLRAGWFLPVEWAAIMPALALKIPSGSYNKNNSVNFGDGQTDLVAELYFFKLMQPLSFDALFKYAVRFRNPQNSVAPGNEFTAEGVGGEVYYGRFDNVKISLAAYQDVLTYNTNEGVLVLSRITIRF